MPRDESTDDALLTTDEIVTVVRAMPGLVALIDAELLRVIATSPELEAMLVGLPPDLVDRAIAQHPTLVDTTIKAAHGRSSTEHLRLPLAIDDTEVHVDFLYRGAPVGDGRLLAIAVVTDVSTAVATEQSEQRARAELESVAERHRMVFEHSVFGIVVHGTDGRITDLNPAALRILDAASLDELIGRDSDDERWQAVQSDGRPFPGEAHPAMVTLRTGEPVHGVVMGIAVDGGDARRWIRVSASAVRQDGEIIAVFSTFEDITERWRLQQQLDRRTAVLDALMSASPVGFALVDNEHRFVQVNNAFATMSGSVPTALEGRSVHETAPSYAQANRQLFDRVMRLGEPVHDLEVRGARPGMGDEDRVWMVDFLPVTVGDEHIAVGMVVVDITEQRRMEELKAELERARLQEEVAAIARTLDEERAAVAVLQEAVIPTQLPKVDAADVAARYVAASVGPNVGGDWFDVMVLPGGDRMVVVIGDVVGHGVLAARQMLELRHWTQLLAVEHDSPAAVLDELNDAVFATRSGAMATVLVVLIDLPNRSMRWATAGHPPPIVRPAGGAATLLEPTFVAPPIGVVEQFHASVDEIALGAGDVVVCFSDGLVERSRESIDDGFARLGRAVDDAPAKFDVLCDHVLDALDSGDQRRDDISIVAVRIR